MNKPAMPFSEDGQKLIALLKKAAGVDGLRVRSLECRVAHNECIQFKVALHADEVTLHEAVSECDVTRLGEAVVEVTPCP